MTRREAVRVVLFQRARLVGLGGGARCAVTELSAVGALLTVTSRLPRPPLHLELELAGEQLVLAAEIQRARPGEHVAIAFVDPPTDRLHHLIAAEQRTALAAGRVNVRERRTRWPRANPRRKALRGPTRRSTD